MSVICEVIYQPNELKLLFFRGEVYVRTLYALESLPAGIPNEWEMRSCMSVAVRILLSCRPADCRCGLPLPAGLGWQGCPRTKTFD